MGLLRQNAPRSDSSALSLPACGRQARLALFSESMQSHCFSIAVKIRFNSWLNNSVPKIKTFRSSSGLDILVGQDDESNDELTFRIAHLNDIWLHVSGSSGSHVILRCGEAGVEPDKNSLKEAAGLAAWFSKMRSGGNVAVSYCPARNVHKPRRAKAGSVTISGAKKIKVQPALLDETE